MSDTTYYKNEGIYVKRTPELDGREAYNELGDDISKLTSREELIELVTHTVGWGIPIQEEEFEAIRHKKNHS